MTRAKGVSSDLRDAVAAAKAFCEQRNIECSHSEDMPFVQAIEIRSVDEWVAGLGGYMTAVLEDKPVDMIVVPPSDRMKPTTFLFQDRIVENQYNFPTSAAARKQSQFPKSLGQSKTFGGVEFPSRAAKKRKDDAFKGKSIRENMDGIFTMVSHQVLGVRDGSGNAEPSQDVTIQTLNRLRAGEVTAFLQYELFSVVVPSMYMAGLEQIFSEHEEHERKHAKMLSQRIHELGGTPVADLSHLASMAPYQVREATTAAEMVSVLREQEEIAIEGYKKAIQEVSPSDPVTRRLLEDILSEEEEHRADMASMLEEV
jgi:bacterioferritin